LLRIQFMQPLECLSINFCNLNSIIKSSATYMRNNMERELAYESKNHFLHHKEPRPQHLSIKRIVTHAHDY
jgi:hypothetical protein